MNTWQEICMQAVEREGAIEEDETDQQSRKLILAASFWIREREDTTTKSRKEITSLKMQDDQGLAVSLQTWARKKYQILRCQCEINQQDSCTQIKAQDQSKMKLIYRAGVARMVDGKHPRPFRGKRGDHECKAQDLHPVGQKFWLIDCYHVNISKVHDIIT